MEDYKERSPYYGVPVSCVALIVVPLILYWVVRMVIFKFQTQFSYELNAATARAMGFGVGALFHIACILAGAMTEPLRAVLSRLKEFFSNLTISFKLACSCYVHDLRDLGVVFWIYAAIMGTNLYLCIDGFRDFLELYLPMMK